MNPTGIIRRIDEMIGYGGLMPSPSCYLFNR